MARLSPGLRRRFIRWISHPLSVIGRNSLIKMIVFPRFVFLFQNIPMLLPRQMFDVLRSILIKLAWAGNQPRVKWDILTLPYTMGGLIAPDLEIYNRTALCSHVIERKRNENFRGAS